METSNVAIDFNKVYKQYYSEILSFCTFRLHSKDLAEEVANDSFMKLYNNLDSYKPEKSKFKTWLFTIVNNTIIDYQRSLSRECNKHSIDNISNNNCNKVYDINSHEKSAIDILNNKDISNKVLSAINSLNNDILIKVANLYFINDYSYNEISNVLEIPLGSVKGYIYRIRIELQKSLRDKKMFI